MKPGPISCTLTASELTNRQRELQEELCAGVQEAGRLDDGIALQLPGSREWLERASQLVAFERECCPFLLLEIKAEPERGPIWLHLRGPEGTVEFLTTMFRECGVSV
jgi:hypothetical protein